MNKLLLLVLFIIAMGRAAADGVDAFRDGLQAFQLNGAEALLRTWYNTQDQTQIDAVRIRLSKVTKGLGEVVDTEVFAPKSIGKHIQRLYGVIYFSEHPVWVRAEYYSIAGRNGFLSIEFSREANDILPLEIGVSSR